MPRNNRFARFVMGSDRGERAEMQERPAVVNEFPLTRGDRTDRRRACGVHRLSLRAGARLNRGWGARVGRWLGQLELGVAACRAGQHEALRAA